MTLADSRIGSGGLSAAREVVCRGRGLEVVISSCLACTRRRATRPGPGFPSGCLVAGPDLPRFARFRPYDPVDVSATLLPISSRNMGFPVGSWSTGNGLVLFLSCAPFRPHVRTRLR